VENEILKQRSDKLDHDVTIKYPASIQELQHKAEAQQEIVRSKDEIIDTIL
jgi:hypothetical protein